ncbi:MAG: phosphatase PAP2 family protein [Gammaproteobacteria bacterium]
MPAARTSSVVRAACGLLFAQFLLAGPAAALDARYLAEDAVDLRALLPAPPAAGSPADEADLEAVLRAQEARTPATTAAAQADAQVSVFRVGDVLGPAFDTSRLPLTTALYREIGRDATAVVVRAKKYWKRPRPPQASDRVKPVVETTSNDSYPSGHALYGCLVGALLGLMVPEQRAALLARGDAFAWNRVVGGAHYPTDVAAGCTSGKIIAAVLLQNPRFRADLAAARDESRRVLGLAPAR